jgi:hypothetical protein
MNAAATDCPAGWWRWISHGALVIVCVLTGVGCGGGGGRSGSTSSATGSGPATASSLSRSVDAWKGSAISYDAVLRSCSTALNPGRGYWPNCTGAKRRAYTRATARLRDQLGDGQSEASCANFRASARASVQSLTVSFRRAWLAVESALSPAHRGSQEDGASAGISPPELLGRADSATKRDTDRLTQLASHLQTACAA